MSTDEFEVLLISEAEVATLQPAFATGLAESISSAVAVPDGKAYEFRVGHTAHGLTKADAARLALLVAQAATSANVFNAVRIYLEERVGLSAELARKFVLEIRELEATLAEAEYMQSDDE